MIQLWDHQQQSIDLLRRSLSAGEEWRSIPGYEGLYEVSSFGRVRSLDREIRTVSRSGTEASRFCSGRLVKLKLSNPSKDNVRPRLRLVLYKNGIHENWLVHRLVMLAFVGPCPDGMEVAHNNGDCLDNRIENLRYATKRENAEDKFEHGDNPCGERNGQAKLTEADVRYIRNMIGKMSQRNLGKMFSVAISTIADIQRHRSWRHIQ